MTEKLERVPPAWGKLHTKAQRALLRSEASALRGMRDVACTVHEHVTAQLVHAKGHRHALMGVRASRAIMAHVVAASITEARTTARTAARERLDDEMMLLERQLAELGIEVPPLLPKESDAAEDEIIATSLGESYASAWAAAMLLVILKWKRDGGLLAPRIRVILVQLDFRLRRIAATETARAYNAEHDEGIGYVASQHTGSRWIAGLFKRWDATLDRRTCVTCRNHDGEIALASTSFAHGDRPAEVHAICRCLDSVIFLPLRIRAAEDTEAQYVTNDEDETV